MRHIAPSSAPAVGDDDASRDRVTRVLHVYSGNLYGGLETFLVTLARYQASAPDIENHFALCFAGQLSHELINARAAVHFLGQARASRPAQIWRCRKRLKQLLREGAFDVVVVHSVWTQALFGSALRVSGAKVVFWLHDQLRAPQLREMWMYLPAKLNRPDIAICDSRFTLSGLHHLYSDISAQVLYYPVSESDGGSQSRAALRLQYGAGAEDLVIIQSSRMERWKGQALHLEALARLRDVPGWTCWMVGGPQRPSEEKYFKEIRELAVNYGLEGRVHFFGHRKDVPQLLRAADVHCQPNTGPEPFGITFIEALYAGLPVVTTALGGAKEIVDNTCGILVDEGDAAGLSQALRSLIADRALRSRLSAGGPARAKLLCNPVTQVRALQGILMDVRTPLAATG